MCANGPNDSRRGVSEANAVSAKRPGQLRTYFSLLRCATPARETVQNELGPCGRSGVMGRSALPVHGRAHSCLRGQQRLLVGMPEAPLLAPGSPSALSLARAVSEARSTEWRFSVVAPKVRQENVLLQRVDHIEHRQEHSHDNCAHHDAQPNDHDWLHLREQRFRCGIHLVVVDGGYPGEHRVP